MSFRNIFIAVFALTVAACSKPAEPISEHHSESKIQYTVYSHDLELFAEADQLIVGEECGILAHFTKLSDFKPIEESIVSLKLTTGENEISQTLTQSKSPGIYKFAVSPLQSGKAKLEFSIQTGNISYLIQIPDIEVYASKDAVQHSGSQLQMTNATVFTKEQSWKINFATDSVRSIPFAEIIKTSAQVLSVPNDEIIISAKTSGLVKISEEYILEGMDVNKNQKLLQIAGSGNSTENISVQYKEARNQYEKAGKDLKRMKKLSKDQIISRKDLLEAETIYKNAKSEFENLKNNFSSSGQKVISPISGYIQKVYVKNGESVSNGQALLSISNNRSLILHAELPAKYAPKLPLINSAVIHLTAEDLDYTLEDLKGKILSYGRVTNAENYLLPFNLEIKNNGKFVPGGFVELFLRSRESSNSIALPEGSVIEEQGVHFVFVQINPELFEKREVKTGATDGTQIEILSGIKTGERIVTQGAMMIKLAQARGGLNPHSGHNH